ncbi:putative integrase [Methylobacterium sp. ME121]|nr:putative integrase [Methylobacterium sp. ME121]GEM97430.1 hypothetical protein MRA01_19700 [Methylobacterium radiotolerans]
MRQSLAVALVLYLAGPHRASDGAEPGLSVPARPRAVPPLGARWGPSSSARRTGTTGYHAKIAVKRDGKVHRETRTVHRRAAAPRARKREAELGAPAAAVPDDA